MPSGQSHSGSFHVLCRRVNAHIDRRSRDRARESSPMLGCGRRRKRSSTKDRMAPQGFLRACSLKRRACDWQLTETPSLLKSDEGRCEVGLKRYLHVGRVGGRCSRARALRVRPPVRAGYPSLACLAACTPHDTHCAHNRSSSPPSLLRRADATKARAH